MPTVPPITDRIAGCRSSFLVDHHKMPTETRVAVASIRWSSCQGQNTYQNFMLLNFGYQTTLCYEDKFSKHFIQLKILKSWKAKIYPTKRRVKKTKVLLFFTFQRCQHGLLTCTVDVFSKKFRIRGFISKMSSGIHVSPILGKVLNAWPWKFTCKRSDHSSSLPKALLEHTAFQIKNGRPETIE